jgi:hypothetical protein
MILDLPIYAWGGFGHRVLDRPPRLKPLLDACPWRAPRRSDRLTQLGLLGLAACPGTEDVSRETPLILASGEANLASTIQTNEQIFVEHRLPSPISFINSVNNSTAFHLHQTLGIDGPTLTVARDECSLEAALQIAALWQHEHALPLLVGTVDEAPDDIDLHRSRMAYPRDAILGEGSYWLRCGTAPGEAEAAARIRFCGSLTDARAAEAFCREQNISHHILTEQVDPARFSRLPGERLEPPSPGRYSTQNGYYLVAGLAQLAKGERLCLINRKRRSSRFSLTLIDRF